MTEDEKRRRGIEDRKFYAAEQEARFEKQGLESHTPQTEHPSYKLAFQDKDFLLREELRPVRFQLELLKPEMCEARQQQHLRLKKKDLEL